MNKAQAQAASHIGSADTSSESREVSPQVELKAIRALKAIQDHDLTLSTEWIMTHCPDRAWEIARARPNRKWSMTVMMISREATNGVGSKVGALGELRRIAYNHGHEDYI